MDMPPSKRDVDSSETLSSPESWWIVLTILTSGGEEKTFYGADPHVFPRGKMLDDNKWPLSLFFGKNLKDWRQKKKRFECLAFSRSTPPFKSDDKNGSRTCWQVHNKALDKISCFIVGVASKKEKERPFVEMRDVAMTTSTKHEIIIIKRDLLLDCFGPSRKPRRIVHIE